MLFAWALAGASALWLLILAAASVPASGEALQAAVRTFASFVCHQIPERTFFWGSEPWPVCARCLGLYASAPVGAVFALGLRTARAFDARANARLLTVAGAPTLLTWLAEFGAGLPMSNVVRFVAALPLGAGVAWVLVRTAIDARRSAISQYTLTDARRGPTR